MIVWTGKAIKSLQRLKEESLNGGFPASFLVSYQDILNYMYSGLTKMSTKHQYELFTIWRKEGQFFNRLNGSSLFWFDSEIIEARQVRFERSKKRNSSYDGKKLIYNDLF